MSTSPPEPGKPITLAVVNARIWCADPRRPWVDALAVRDARIDRMGGSAEIRKIAPASARIIDAQGGAVGSVDGMPLAPGAPADFTVVQGARVVFTVVGGSIQPSPGSGESA